MQFIDLTVQQQRIRPQVDAAIKRVLDHGQYIMGPEVAELEERLADHVGVKHAIGCSSGTDALLLALMAYGVGPGDAIFTTPFSFFATSEVIALTGATPVFADIDPVTFNIDPHQLKSAINRVVGEGCLVPKGIIPVDLFGLPADYDAIMAIADEYGLFVLEDAAQAFGAIYKGRKAPGLAHVGAASFFPAKPLGCYGDGGAVFTNNDEIAAQVRSLLVHGKGRDKYDNVCIGLNARLDTLQAAILLEKLKVYPEELDMRQQVAQRYSEGLIDISGGTYGVSPPVFPNNMTPAWAQYTVRCKSRDELRGVLLRAGIPTMVYYTKPLHLIKALDYLGYQSGDFPVSELASEVVLSLPFYPYLSSENQSRILEILR